MSIRTIEAIVEIEEDRKLIVQLPADIPIGTHRVVAVLDDAPASCANGKGETDREWKFPVLTNSQWPADMPLRREEMYDDDGR